MTLYCVPWQSEIAGNQKTDYCDRHGSSAHWHWTSSGDTSIIGTELNQAVGQWKTQILLGKFTWEQTRANLHKGTVRLTDLLYQQSNTIITMLLTGLWWPKLHRATNYSMRYLNYFHQTVVYFFLYKYLFWFLNKMWENSPLLWVWWK